MHAHHAFAIVNVPQSLRSHGARPPCWQDCGPGGIFSCAEFSDHSVPPSTLLQPVFGWIAREGPHEVQL